MSLLPIVSNLPVCLPTVRYKERIRAICSLAVIKTLFSEKSFRLSGRRNQSAPTLQSKEASLLPESDGSLKSIPLLYAV